MCNLYSMTRSHDALRQLFRVRPERSHLGNQPPLPAIFPRHEAPVLRLVDGAAELVPMHWGFPMPQTSKRTGEPILPKPINNARDDKVRTSPFWRESFETRRCLVPASSFCEAKGRKPATYVWFALRGDEPRPPMVFAGLWRRWRGRYRDGEIVELDAYTILTTTPNDLVRPVHPERMPVILAEADRETWLAGSPDEAHALCRPCPASAMRIVQQGRDLKGDEGGSG